MARYNMGVGSRVQTITGRIVRGHKVASQRSKEYPYGTIEKQKPVFKQLGLDLDRFFNGTLNISIAPKRWMLHDPEITFENVDWTELHPPETFSFIRCSVIFKDFQFDGWVYSPHPSTKLRHFQDASVIEVITEKIPGIHYDDEIQIVVDPLRLEMIG